VGVDVPSEDWLRVFIALGIFIVWVCWNAADALSGEIGSNAFIQAPMMAVVGWLFAGPIIKKKDNDEERKEPRRVRKR
jgi:hypothetical protein